MYKVIDKVKKEDSPKAIYIASAIVPLILMLIVFIARGIYPFGDESFLQMDLYHQYLPFLNEFNNIIKEGGSLLYTWRAGLGNNFLAMIAYYLATPTNLLSLLVDQRYLIEFVSYMAIVKTALSGLTFSIYLRKHSNKNSKAIILFSVAYSMSAFFAAYNWNTMWLDCLIMAPLIILGLELLVKEGKMSLYILSLGFTIFTNYYISIMICMFLVLYFIVLWIPAKNKLRAIGQFSVASIISGGIASVLLLPEIQYMLSSEYARGKLPTNIKQYYNFFDAFCRHFMNVDIELGLDHWPNIYCGVAILFLLFIFLFTSKISLAERIPRFLLGLFMFISFGFNISDYIWHGMNYPNSLPARQTFLYIILLLTMAYDALLYIRETRWPWIIISGLLSAGIVAAAAFFVKDDAFSIWAFVGTGTALVIYFVLLIIYKKTTVASSGQTIAFAFTIAFVMVEFTTNMLYTGVYTVTRSTYVNNQNNYAKLASDIRGNDPGEYRIEKVGRTTQNDSMLSDFTSATMFSSVSNALVHEFYDRYGLRLSKVFYCYDGATPVTSALFNVKYVMSDSIDKDDPFYERKEEYNQATLYKCKYYLPFGFMIPSQDFPVGESPKELLKESEELTRKAGNKFQAQNELAKSLGATEDIFTYFDVVNTSGTTIIDVPEDGRIYAYTTNGGISKIKAAANGQTKSFTGYTDNYIMDLGYQKAGTIITLSAEGTESSLNTRAVRLNTAVMDQLIEKLTKDEFKVSKKDSSCVIGTINASKAGDLFLSIPYDENWRIKVDGKVVKAKAFSDCFISLELTEGSHDIELYYENKTLVVGLVLSLLCIGIWLTIFFYEREKS